LRWLVWSRTHFANPGLAEAFPRLNFVFPVRRT
jgi:hypothetical protein